MISCFVRYFPYSVDATQQHTQFIDNFYGLFAGKSTACVINVYINSDRLVKIQNKRLLSTRFD